MKHFYFSTRVAGLLVLLLMLTNRVAPISAQESGFTETFDDPTLPGWEHSPNVAVVDGVLRLEPGGFAFHPGEWGDQTLTVRVRRSGEGELVISYRAGDAGAYHVVLGGDFLVLQREAGGAVAELGAAPASIPPSAWTQVGVNVSEGEHTVALEGEPVLTATDADPLPPGGIAFEVLGEAVGEFDDLVQTIVGEAPPPAGPTPTLEASPVAEPDIAPASVPAYQALPWVRTGGPIGGLGYDVRYNFADHNIWYVTDAWSGFHMSTDNGLTWTPSNEGITSRKGIDAIPIFSATVDPHDPNTIWIGTDLTGDIFRSTDNGHTWVKMADGVDPNLRPLSFRGFTIDPRTSDIVYAMGEIGSLGWTPDGSERKGLEQDMTQGVVYKTTDGGEHWTEIWRGDNLARYCWIDPRDPDTIYISTGIFDREAANTDVTAGFAGGVGILKSTDGGQTWRVLNQENGLLDLFVGSLYMHPGNPDVLLAAAGQNNWSYYEGRSTAGVFLTEDGGEHWDRVLAGKPAEGFGELFSVVEYCTSDPNVAYAASDYAVYRSDDGGHTWQQFNRPNGTWGPPGIVAGMPIDMQCDPVDPMRVFVNNYLGGNFLSEDGGQTWVLASEGYTGALVHHLAVAPGRPQTVFAGSRSGVYRSDNGGDEWVGLVYPPEGMFAKFNEIVALAVDPTDADHLLTMAADFGTILYSHDGGQSWHIGRMLGGLNELIFAPSDPSTVYAAVTPRECIDSAAVLNPMIRCDAPEMGLYVSRDGGVTWASAPSGQVSGGVLIAAVAVHPRDADTVYVSIPNVGVLKTNNGGQSWTPSGTGLPSLPVIALSVDPSNPDNLFAGVAMSELAPAGGGVYRSADGGATWTHSSAGLNPEALVRSTVVDPANGQIVYAGDHHSGVYLSTDGGQTWRTLNEGLIHRTVNVLALSDDGTVLYAAIEGDGVYRLGAPPEPLPTPAATATPPPVLGTVEGPTLTRVAAVPTSTPPPAQPTAPPEAAHTPTPKPSGRGGICGGTAALPLALVGIFWVYRYRR